MRWRKLEGKRIAARLIEAGLAPRYVRRVTRELEDHLSDIEEELRADGSPTNEIESEARRRLGDEDALVRRIIAQTPPPSLVSRYAAAVFSVGAFALAAVLVLGTLGILIAVTNVFARLGYDDNILVVAFGSAHYIFTAYFVAPVLTGIMCWTAYSYGVKLRWPLVAAVIIAVAGGVFLEASLTFTPGTGPGPHGNYSIGFGLYHREWITSFWRFTSPFAVFATFSAWIWRQRESGLSRFDF